MGEASGSLVLVRHGESVGNAEEIFSGLLDVPLTALGRAQAGQAAALLRAASITPHVAVASQMTRARQTLDVMLDGMDPAPPVHIDWRLNERHYGALSGLTKRSVRERYGHTQFIEWRRSMHVAPPPHPNGLPVLAPATSSPFEDHRDELGPTESLWDVMVRVGALLAEVLLPELEQGRCVLVMGHGNSLRALCAILDDLTDHEVRELNLPTAQPLIYQLGDDGGFMPRGGRYLDPETAVAAAALIAAQGGT